MLILLAIIIFKTCLTVGGGNFERVRGEITSWPDLARHPVYYITARYNGRSHLSINVCARRVLVGRRGPAQYERIFYNNITYDVCVCVIIIIIRRSHDTARRDIRMWDISYL